LARHTRLLAPLAERSRQRKGDGDVTPNLNRMRFKLTEILTSENGNFRFFSQIAMSVMSLWAMVTKATPTNKFGAKSSIFVLDFWGFGFPVKKLRNSNFD